MMKGLPSKENLKSKLVWTTFRRWDTDESISELDDLKTVRDDPEEHHRFFGSAADAISNAQTNQHYTDISKSIEIPEACQLNSPTCPIPNMPNKPTHAV
jgi:hypothetical protein